jgi:hypothetical protein
MHSVNGSVRLPSAVVYTYSIVQRSILPNVAVNVVGFIQNWVAPRSSNAENVDAV